MTIKLTKNMLSIRTIVQFTHYEECLILYHRTLIFIIIVCHTFPYFSNVISYQNLLYYVADNKSC